MLAVALGLKLISLEEIYKELGKLVCAEPVLKENEAATWRKKLDQLYKSSSQSLRVVVHGAKRYGICAYWDNPYLTLDPEYEVAQIEGFWKMTLQGYIYKGRKPVHWSPSS